MARRGLYRQPEGVCVSAITMLASAFHTTSFGHDQEPFPQTIAISAAFWRGIGLQIHIKLNLLIICTFGASFEGLSLRSAFKDNR